MERKAKSKNTDITAHLEAIAGRKIGPPIVPIGPINLFYLLASIVSTTGGPDFPSSLITWRNLLYDDVTHASVAPLVDVAGAGGTDGSGKSVFRLSTFVGGEVDAAEPVNIVATPHGDDPTFLTTDHTIVDADDVEITVYAWAPNGKPAPNVAFDWRCRCVTHGDE